jgi:hypothetical protein
MTIFRTQSVPSQYPAGRAYGKQSGREAYSDNHALKKLRPLFPDRCGLTEAHPHGTPTRSRFSNQPHAAYSDAYLHARMMCL